MRSFDNSVVTASPPCGSQDTSSCHVSMAQHGLIDVEDLFDRAVFDGRVTVGEVIVADVATLGTGTVVGRRTFRDHVID